MNEKLKAELMREYNSRYFNEPVPVLPEETTCPPVVGCLAK